MKQRIITAVVAVALFLPVLYFSHTVVWEIVMGLFAIIGTVEVIRCIGMENKLWLVIPALAYSVSLPCLTLVFDDPLSLHTALLLATLLYLFVLLFAGVFHIKELPTHVYASLFSLSVYVVLPFVALICLRRANHGLYLCILVFVASWITDTFAYFTGYFLGKHKLAPFVSPKKTIEGSIGGTLFAIGGCMGYGALIGTADSAVIPHYLALAVVGLILSIVSQLGDLAASAVKRSYGIKDYGKLFPGHGGILDRFDSVIAVSAFLWILNEMPGIFRIFTFA